MSDLSRRSQRIQKLVHEALAARVRVLLGQTGYDPLMATQIRVSQELSRLGAQVYAQTGHDGQQLLEHVVYRALSLDSVYYGGSELEFIVSEGLTSAGLSLAEAVRGHEHDDFDRWQAEVVPTLDAVQAFVVSVFDGRWMALAGQPALATWLKRPAA